MGGAIPIQAKATHHARIRDWIPSERPREKLLNRGIWSLSDAEILSVLIRTGTSGITAFDLALTLLQEYGSISRLATRSVQELRAFRGMGESKAVGVVAAFELGRRASAGRETKNPPITSPDDVVRYFQPVLSDLKQEMFRVLLLDSANHLLRDVIVSTGILNSSLVHPREVFQPAIIEPAASVILLHNHPSGNPEPSGEDIQITRQLVEAGKILGIPVHDHVIIAGNKCASFAERGLL